MAESRAETTGGGNIATEIPSKNLAPVEYTDLPEPLPMKRVLGPSVLLLAGAIGSGEYVLWPYITSQVGLALVWLHRPVPRAALPRWRACQQALWHALRHLGADRLAGDAARVLRLVGTRHGGSGGLVEAMPDLFVPTVQKAAEKHVLSTYVGTFKVKAAELGDTAGALGAAAWAAHMTSECA